MQATSVKYTPHVLTLKEEFHAASETRLGSTEVGKSDSGQVTRTIGRASCTRSRMDQLGRYHMGLGEKTDSHM